MANLRPDKGRFSQTRHWQRPQAAPGCTLSLHRKMMPTSAKSNDGKAGKENKKQVGQGWGYKSVTTGRVPHKSCSQPDHEGRTESTGPEDMEHHGDTATPGESAVKGIHPIKDARIREVV